MPVRQPKFGIGLDCTCDVPTVPRRDPSVDGEIQGNGSDVGRRGRPDRECHELHVDRLEVVRGNHGGGVPGPGLPVGDGKELLQQDAGGYRQDVVRPDGVHDRGRPRGEVESVAGVEHRLVEEPGDQHRDLRDNPSAIRHVGRPVHRWPAGRGGPHRAPGSFSSGHSVRRGWHPRGPIPPGTVGLVGRCRVLGRRPVTNRPVSAMPPDQHGTDRDGTGRYKPVSGGPRIDLGDGEPVVPNVRVDLNGGRGPEIGRSGLGDHPGTCCRSPRSPPASRLTPACPAPSRAAPYRWAPSGRRAPRAPRSSRRRPAPCGPASP